MCPHDTSDLCEDASGGRRGALTQRIVPECAFHLLLRSKCATTGVSNPTRFGVPLGILQIVFALRLQQAPDAFFMTSLVTTWCMLVRLEACTNMRIRTCESALHTRVTTGRFYQGMKLVRVPELPKLWKYSKKQNEKVPKPLLSLPALNPKP